MGDVFGFSDKHSALFHRAYPQREVGGGGGVYSNKHGI